MTDNKVFLKFFYFGESTVLATIDRDGRIFAATEKANGAPYWRDWWGATA